MLGVSLIIIAAAIVYMVETYISTYYTIEYMHGTSLFLVLLAEYGTPVLFLLLCAYIAYRNFLKKQKAAASAASERPTSKEELYTNKIQTAVKTKSVFSECLERREGLRHSYCGRPKIRFNRKNKNHE